jgi:hypothetical protein
MVPRALQYTQVLLNSDAPPAAVPPVAVLDEWRSLDLAAYAKDLEAGLYVARERARAADASVAKIRDRAEERVLQGTVRARELESERVELLATIEMLFQELGEATAAVERTRLAGERAADAASSRYRHLLERYGTLVADVSANVEAAARETAAAIDAVQRGRVWGFKRTLSRLLRLG